MPRIRFDFGTVVLEADLLDTPTARLVAAVVAYGLGRARPGL